MVWLVQNCRSNKCLIPKIPRASGGFAPLGSLPGFYPGPVGDLKRSPDPSPTHAPPLLTTNPGSAPGICVYYFMILSCCLHSGI